jgi:hypothetical protein
MVVLARASGAAADAADAAIVDTKLSPAAMT